MSSPYAGAAQALAAAFFTRTLRLAPADAARLGVTETERCGLTANSGATVAGDARAVARGDYTLSLPAGTAHDRLPEGLVVTIDEEPGRLLTIVWAPLTSNLNLSRRYGVSEVR